MADLNTPGKYAYDMGVFDQSADEGKWIRN